MKMSELIAKLGDENIQFQNLDSALVNLDYKLGKGTKITFGTEQPCSPLGTDKLGLVVWVDRKQLKEIIGK